MDLTTDKVSDDSSVSSKSSNSFVEISSDPCESSPELPNFSGYCYPEYLYDPEAEAFYSLYKLGHTELIEKYLQCEKELRTTSLKLQESEQKLQESEQEIEKLKEAQKKASDLSAELEIAQKRVADLETDLSDSNSKYDNLKNEFDVNMEASYVHISNLNAILYNCQLSLSTVIANQQTDIACLSANQTFFESMIREMEDHLDNADAEKLQLHEKQFDFFKSMIAEMEDLLEYSDAEKLQLQKKEFELQRQLNLLKTDLANRTEHIEALKKESEMNEKGYDMLMVENIDMELKFSALMTDLVVKDEDIDALITQSETNELRYGMLVEENCDLRTEISDLKAKLGSRGTEIEEVEDLRDKVKELENIIEDQRNVILKKR